MHMKAAHEKAQESIYRQRFVVLHRSHLSPPFVTGWTKIKRTLLVLRQYHWLLPHQLYINWYHSKVVTLWQVSSTVFQFLFRHTFTFCLIRFALKEVSGTGYQTARSMSYTSAAVLCTPLISFYSPSYIWKHLLGCLHGFCCIHCTC